MDDHQKKCQYASLLDKDMHALDWEEISELDTNASFVYSNSTIESIYIGMYYIVRSILYSQKHIALV